MKKKIEILGVVFLLSVVAIIYFTINNDNIKDSVIIKNETMENFEAVGVLMNNKVILNKTNGDRFTIPKSLTSGKDEVSIIAINTNGEILKSQVISFMNQKEINILKRIADGIQINIDGIKKDLEEFTIPKLDKWEMKVEKNIITATFKAKTDANYTLYVWGKGGKFGVSDTLSEDEEAIASWEKPKKIISSWIVLTRD